MLITILTDKTSWMNRYSLELTEILNHKGHYATVISSKNEIPKGDILFLLSCFQLIKQDVLNLNKHNIVVHASELPLGKGWSPMSWQIIEGKNHIPLTLFEVVEEMDAGDVYIRDNIQLDGSELIDELHIKLAKKIINMCLSYVDQYDSIRGHKQSGKSTFYRKRAAKDSELDIDKSIKEQFNLLRIVDNENYPAFFLINGQKYILKIYKDHNE